MVDQDTFRTIFEMGYDFAKYNRQTNFFGSDSIEPVTEDDIQERYTVFQDMQARQGYDSRGILGRDVPDTTEE